MENALLFTGLLLGAALTGGYFGACCAKSRQGEDLAKKLQALQDRIEFLETKVQDADERLCLCERYDGESAQRIADCELLIGDTRNQLGEDKSEVNLPVVTKLADLEIRADEMCDHIDNLRYEMKEAAKRLEERLAECELLIGDPPTEGLLGRVGALEEVRRKEDLLTRVNMLTDEVRTIGGRFDLFEGGASLEIEGLRKSVEALEGKAHG